MSSTRNIVSFSHIEYIQQNAINVNYPCYSVIIKTLLAIPCTDTLGQVSVMIYELPQK
jgi:hypothetical protein